MQYTPAPDLDKEMYDIIERLEWNHIDPERVSCVRSKGSSSRNTIARVHSLPKAMQLGMKCKAFYVIEFLERFERLPAEEKTETIIHELMHIPKNFGGGFRHHDYVKDRIVRKNLKEYLKRKKRDEKPLPLFDFIFRKKKTEAIG